MKKTVSIFLVALLCVSLLAGCTDDVGNVSQSTNGDVNGTNSTEDRMTSPIPSTTDRNNAASDPTGTTNGTNATGSGEDIGGATGSGATGNGSADNGIADNGTGGNGTGTGAAQG